MPPRKEPSKDTTAPRRQPATTPEDREKQLIAYAVDLAEDQIRAGTASSQVITHFLKLGTSTEQLAKEKLRHENLRMEAQIEEMKSRQRGEDLMKEVLDAMKLYAGVDDDDDI